MFLLSAIVPTLAVPLLLLLGALVANVMPSLWLERLRLGRTA